MNETKLVELLNDEKVIEVLESKNHLNLAKFIGRELCDFTENDEKYVDLFWDVVFNKSWIYLSDEIVIEWMGYKKSKDTISDFTEEMKRKYSDIDYKEVDRTHELIKKSTQDSSDNKYYITTGETLKKMLIRADTKQGDIICDYFIKVESVCNTTNKLISMYPIYINQKRKDEIELRDDMRATRANILAYEKKLTNDELLLRKKTVFKSSVDFGIFWNFSRLIVFFSFD